MSRTVAELLVGVLEQIGVKQIFGLIGDSLNPLADAVRRRDIEWIGVRHEEGAALAAAGQVKLTDRGRLSMSIRRRRRLIRSSKNCVYIDSETSAQRRSQCGWSRRSFLWQGAWPGARAFSAPA